MANGNVVRYDAADFSYGPPSDQVLPESIAKDLEELTTPNTIEQLGRTACAQSSIAQRTPEVISAGLGGLVHRVIDGNEDPQIVEPHSGRTPADTLHDMHFSGGLAASGPEGAFASCMFVRDYLAAMEDLITLYPEVVRAGFSIIPQQQGIKYDDLTEEQPGRLPHQVVKGMVGGRVLPDEAMEGYRHWAEVWGVPVDEHGGFTVYNASDGIRYLDVLEKYISLYDDRVLNDKFLHEPTGEIRTVRQAARMILDWTVSTIETSEEGGPGLFEVRATNPRQTSWSGVMRDGLDSYWHPEGPHGKDVNRDKPIAYISNQGLAISALQAGAKLFPDDPKVHEWLRLAGELQYRTAEHFWLDSEKYWGAAVDRDPFGKPRPVKLIGNEPLELLATDFFQPADLMGGIDLTDLHDLHTMTALRVADPGLMTPIGPTMLHARHAELEGEDYYPYQGTASVWPVAVRRIAAGYRKEGLDPIAHDLGFRRLVAGLQIASCLPEYFFIDRESREPNYAVLRRGILSNKIRAIGAAELAVSEQTWTATAALAELEAERHLRALLSRSAYVHDWRDSHSWEAKICRQYFIETQDLPPASKLPETSASKNGQPTFRIDTDLGNERRQQLQEARRL
jgi:glycogen debranching enzyme